MSSVLSIPKLWTLLKRFKNRCKSRGWETSEHADWVRADGDYHSFLWIRTVHLSTFEKVAMNRRMATRKGPSYKVVDVSYTAWLFPQTPPPRVVARVLNTRELSRRTAIYDLSEAYEGQPACTRLNQTQSPVFQEFENFLIEERGIEFNPIQQTLDN